MNRLRRIFEVMRSDEFCEVSGPAVACVVIIVVVLSLYWFVTRTF